MGSNKERNYKRSNRSSQDGINHNFSGRIKSRARSNQSKRNLPSSTIFKPTLNPSPPLTNIVALDDNASNDKQGFNNMTNGLVITGIVIGTLTVLTIIAYLLIRIVKKRRESSKSREVQEDEEPRLTLNFVKHNHPIPELCTTPDTQPILDYYSSKAGLTDASSPPIINSNKVNKLSHGHFIKEEDNNDHKPTSVEVNENTKKSSEENVNDDYIPQYYNGMEIPPLGARIIPLERQVQIAKELASANLSTNNHKRKSNRRSISSILSISSRRKSSTSNYHYNINNSSTTNSLTQISETPLNEGVV